MSLIRQSDVKNHLSPRFRTKIHLCEPVSQPDATGFSETEPEAIKAEPPMFVEDFVAEHSTGVPAAAPAGGVTVSNGLQKVTNKKERTSVKPHSVFLRKRCILPDRLDPLREPAGEDWSLVEEITAPVLDTMIRRMGWHFLSVLRPFRRRGFGRTEANAAQNALTGALKRVARQYNAAELIGIHATKYPGFHVAIATMQPRLIQQYTSLEVTADWHRMIVPTR